MVEQTAEAVAPVKAKSKLYATVRRGEIEHTIESTGYNELRKSVEAMGDDAEVVRIIRGREIKFTKKSSIKFF